MTPRKYGTYPRNKLAKFLALLLIALGIAACEKNKNLNPPHNGESVDISINVPEGFAPHDIKAIYRSNTCTYSGISRANGSEFTRDGYQNLTLTPAAPPGGKIYHAEVPVDGGGDCNWRLSNIIFGLGYSQPEKFGDGVAIGRPISIVVRVDDNPPPVGGDNETSVSGDLMIQKDFYPWIREHYVGGHKTTINLISQHGLHISFYAPKTRKIHFDPKIHSRFIVHSKGSKEKKIGAHPLFSYADGRTLNEKLGHPNFETLQSIRAKAEQVEQRLAPVPLLR